MHQKNPEIDSIPNDHSLADGVSEYLLEQSRKPTEAAIPCLDSSSSVAPSKTIKRFHIQNSY